MSENQIPKKPENADQQNQIPLALVQETIGQLFLQNKLLIKQIQELTSEIQRLKGHPPLRKVPE